MSLQTRTERASMLCMFANLYSPSGLWRFYGGIHVRYDEINNKAFPKHPEKGETPSNRQQNYDLTIAENTALSSLIEGIKTRQGKARFILSRLNK